jgi:quercetin dioxygenase-like cupin family protein
MLSVSLDDAQLQDYVPGLRAGFPLHSAAGTASTATVLFELDPGGALPAHRDSAEELLLVLQGEADATIGRETARLATGEIAVVPAMELHGVNNVGETTLRILGFFSSSTVIATFDEPLAPGAPQVFAIGGPVEIAVPLEAATA